jgi:hypothetical protein
MGMRSRQLLEEFLGWKGAIPNAETRLAALEGDVMGTACAVSPGHNQPIPQNEKLVRVEELTVAVP